MTVGTYGPRTRVHATRQGARKTSEQLWIALHTSEGSEGTVVAGNSAAEQLCQFQTQPATATNVASYHAVFDTDRILPCVEDEIVAYSAGGGNSQGLHGCFPGRASQTRAQWLDPVSRAQIRQAAAWICDKAAKFSIPKHVLGYSQVRQYQKGLCDHHAISLAFKKSDHTDLGANFPWDVLMADIAALTPTPPPVGDDMIPWRDRVHGISVPGLHLPVQVQLPVPYGSTKAEINISNAEYPAEAGWVDVWAPYDVWKATVVLTYAPGEIRTGQTLVGLVDRKLWIMSLNPVVVNIDIQGYGV